jgi:hypothetical protein
VLLIDGASRVLDRAWTALRPTIAASDGTIVLLARRAAVVGSPAKPGSLMGAMYHYVILGMVSAEMARSRVSGCRPYTSSTALLSDVASHRSPQRARFGLHHQMVVICRKTPGEDRETIPELHIAQCLGD